MEEKFNQLKAILALAEDDMHKFYHKGNKSAGVRLRKNLKDVKDISMEIRKEVLEMKREKV
ncbi:MAG: histone H1 [Fimbriimonadaceae bacterium]|nr:histone H1 [Chitinophagales bacterium]